MKTRNLTPFEERRVKTVHLHPNLLINVLNWFRNPTYFLTLPVIEEVLPEDSVVVSVQMHWASNTLAAMIASKEFPICPIGSHPEEISLVVTELHKVDFGNSAIVEDKEAKETDSCLNS